MPGARDGRNYAQDEQISIRGFGTRVSFGVRSVRLYLDGVPATIPDGQGQVSHVRWRPRGEPTLSRWSGPTGFRTMPIASGSYLVE